MMATHMCCGFFGAIYMDHNDCLRNLCKQNTNINVKDNRNNNGWAPLHMEVRYGNPKSIMILLENKANINQKDNEGMTSLHLAVKYERESHVITLLHHGANVNEKNNDGWTPLHLAIYCNNNIIKLLLHHGANVNEKDNDGRTPLHLASNYDNKHIITLLNYGANFNEKDKRGKSVLDYAYGISKNIIEKWIEDNNFSIKEPCKNE